jgi:hypothetical protein
VGEAVLPADADALRVGVAESVGVVATVLGVVVWVLVDVLLAPVHADKPTAATTTHAALFMLPPW